MPSNPSNSNSKLRFRLFANHSLHGALMIAIDPLQSIVAELCDAMSFHLYFSQYQKAGLIHKNIQ
jgi:hypothetical protein